MSEVPDHIIVTGAGGWLGRALLAALAAGPDGAPDPRRVTALAAAADEVPVIAAALPGVRIVVGDVRSDEDVAALFAGAVAPLLVHAAGVIHPAHPSDFAAVNAAGTARVVGAALAAGTTKVVHISSNSPFGLNPTPSDAFRDHEPYHPYLGYGRSKMQGEQAVRALVEGTPATAVILRPPWFYGPYQPERQATFLKAARTGRFPEPSDREVRRSLVDVRSLAQAVLLSLAAPLEGVNAYWVADAAPYRFGEVLDHVCEAAARVGLDSRRRRLPVPGLATAAMRAVDARLQRSGRYSAPVHVLGELGATIACRVDGAASSLGFVPSQDPVGGWEAAFRWALAAGQDV